MRYCSTLCTCHVNTSLVDLDASCYDSKSFAIFGWKLLLVHFGYGGGRGQGGMMYCCLCELFVEKGKGFFFFASFCLCGFFEHLVFLLFLGLCC